MENDFHYNTVKILSKKAGFNDDDAQIIAYASQFVDDSIAHKPLNITDIPDGLLNDYPASRYNGAIFDPVCTAHRGLQFLSAREKDSQRKVYIPFHFIPSDEYERTVPYNYRVTPNGRLARQLVNKAVLELRQVDGDGSRIRKLVKLGIALHSYADTWAHQGFSGRYSHNDNNIERIDILKGEENLKSYLIRKAGLYNVISDIGHGEALDFPDKSHLSWKYEHNSTKIEVVRNNSSIYMDAANAIYIALCMASGKNGNWKDFAGKLNECFSLSTDSVDDKRQLYRKLFPDTKFEYSEMTWRRESLNGHSLEFSNFDANDYNNCSYAYNGDPKWFYFHIEAFRQREFILSNIRQDLLS